MKDLSQFNKLSERDQILLCAAVLIDGLDAADILGMDDKQGEAFRRIARELSSASPDIRMPLIGTVLRALVQRGRSQ